MKIAVFHNFLDNIGGAEIVALTLARDLNADVYTTNYDMEKIKKMGFSDIKIHSLGKIPLNPPFRQQIALMRFRKLNLRKKYDLYIIAGDWAVSGAVNNKPNLWYVHSPTNELWASYEYVRKNTVPWFMRLIFDLWVLVNRHLMRKYAKNADKIACNSENTKARIRKYLSREARVINPPIETSFYKCGKNKGFWLSVNRLTRHKRIDLQMKAFAKMPDEKLIAVGSYEKGSRLFDKYEQYLKKLKPENMEIISWTDFKTLRKLYSECRGFITTSRKEDFGMTAVEAMASGKPVIAPNEGGYRESVVNGKTGILIDNIDPEKIVNAVKEIGKNPGKYKNACLKQAKQFDTKVFIRKIREIIK
jgi:glycosyltransferase involved in cell wall biosynthesis